MRAIGRPRPAAVSGPKGSASAAMIPACIGPTVLEDPDSQARTCQLCVLPVAMIAISTAAAML